MKTKLILLLPLLVFLIGCSDSEQNSTTFEVSPSSFENISAAGSTIKITIKCSGSWSASSSDSQWCTLNRESGSNNSEITITVNANTDSQPRNATVTVTSNNNKKSVSISQLALDAAAGVHYKIPVIFHVLYGEKNNAKQNVPANQLNKIINMCNSLYKNKLYVDNNKNISQDINIEFVMATEAPNGNTLPEPGVERIQWGSPIMDCEKFMQNENETNTKMLWDLNKYINIFLYEFTNDNIMGIAHLPYSLKSHPLAGLNLGDYYLNNPVKYPHSVSINNTYIDDFSEVYYSPTDVFVTLSHELGHYLGLLHAFSEGENGNKDLCEDTDFCTDTPTYNMEEYNNWLGSLPSRNPNSADGSYTLTYLATKTNCEGKSFVSHNVMDYAYCFSDQFTAQQRARIRHVLDYSPLMPVNRTVTKAIRSTTDDVKPPIRALK